MLEKIIGSMIGSAYGDSLGAAVEFWSLDAIRDQYGPDGVKELTPAFGQPAGVITDDTQMAIATAKGLLMVPEFSRRDDEVVLANIWAAYRDWLVSQKDPRERRSPGMTCTMSLAGMVMGSRATPLNSSAGCGGVMRVHPVGLALWRNPERAFNLGMETAALTHGHQDGYVPAGAMAFLIARLLSGVSFSEAIHETLRLLDKLPLEEGKETVEAIRVAIDVPSPTDPAETIDSQIGRCGATPGGWLGHDALAIAIFAVRVAEGNPLRAVQIAVNHSGDSDSTGAIAGAIAGVIAGPKDFLGALDRQGVRLERLDELYKLGEGLYAWNEKEG